jgi:hypothetical protein
MTHFEPVPSISVTNESLIPLKRKSIFARFLQALHVSRRRQARYFINRHRHLIAPDFGARPIVINFESRKARESNINANGHQTPVVAEERALADA